LSVEDLGSSNGSWLNSTRLQPYVPAPLKSGDRLRLSQIEIEVYFGKPEKDQPEVAGSAT
jgi:pSer/pThr/pTyr-binding forkhead associated (FHA) protein